MPPSLDSQGLLFARTPDAAAVLRGPDDPAVAALRLAVHRNLAFEHTGAFAQNFSQFAGTDLDLSYSDYDDALSSIDTNPDADVHLVALDVSRYGSDGQDAFGSWFAERIEAFRSVGDAPLLVLGSPAADDGWANKVFRDVAAETPGVHYCDVAAIAEEMGGDFFDERMRRVTASNWSRQAHVEVGRAFALAWLPAVIRPRLKAVVIDLDETLYSGVLGEDGIAGVDVSSDHRLIHERLGELKSSGLFLALISRNEETDVEELFRERDDLGIGLTDFDVVRVSWENKSGALRETAAALRIGNDSMLFVDDNVGELADAWQEGVDNTLWAQSPERTLIGLRWFPGLFSFGGSDSDRLRSADLRASEKRASLRRSMTKTEYLRSLKLRLQVKAGEEASLPRVAELSTKTNQFNLTLARLSEAEISRGVRDQGWLIATVALADRLSDSGDIASVVVEPADDEWKVRDLCVSCRALGRELEDAIVISALETIGVREGSTVVIPWETGPRNEPGLSWLRTFISEVGGDDGSFRWSTKAMRDRVERLPVSVLRGSDGDAGD
jgi:FkbH-like protein